VVYNHLHRSELCQIPSIPHVNPSPATLVFWNLAPTSTYLKLFPSTLSSWS
jgi:hypothetical protein